MAADALVSLGVVVSGIVISATGWYVIDPIIGLGESCLEIILVSTTHLLFDSLRLSLDGVPSGVVAPEVAAPPNHGNGAGRTRHSPHSYMGIEYD